MGRQGTQLNSAIGAGQALGGIGQQGVGNQLGLLGVQNNALGTAGTMGNTLAGIGQQGFQNQLATAQGLMGIGNQQQGLGQQSKNIGYQDFLNQKQYPFQQVDYMKGLIQGLPVNQMSTANTAPTPSLAQQLIGNGIGAYNMFNSQPANTMQPVVGGPK
jgi:hypothetical protein